MNNLINVADNPLMDNYKNTESITNDIVSTVWGHILSFAGAETAVILRMKKDKPRILQQSLKRCAFFYDCFFVGKTETDVSKPHHFWY